MTSTLRTIGFIGSGNIGQAVARLAVAAGHDVVMSNSRGPDTLGDVVAGLGPRASAATAEDAAAAGDVVVVTVPLKAYEQVPVAPLAGKVVLDTNNYYPERDGQIASLDDHTATTSGLLQEHLPDAHVVKVFNNIHYRAIGALSRTGDGDQRQRSVLPIFGDDADARTTVTAFLDELGFDAHDGGSFAESWRAENGQPVYALPYADGDDLESPRRADGSTIAALLDRAERG